MSISVLLEWYEVSYTEENIVAVTIYNTGEVVFVNVIANTITNTVDIGYPCYGTDFSMNRLANYIHY
jgi:hypothetical protein